MKPARAAAAIVAVTLAALLAAACSDNTSSTDGGSEAQLPRDLAPDTPRSDAPVDGLRPDGAAGDSTADAARPDSTPPDTLQPDAFSNPNFAITVVDAQGNVGRDVSLALDSSGAAQLAYQSANRGLRFAQVKGAAISTTTLDNAPLGGEFSDIAVGGGVVAIAARASGVPTLWTKAAPWTSAPANSSGGRDIALFVDSAGKAHMCHGDSRGELLQYTYQDGSGFKTETIAGTALSGQKLGAWCDIVVDSSGGVHVSYDNANWLNLGYAYKASGGSWTLDVAAKDNQGKVGSYTAIALDAQGSPLIAHFRSVDNTVALAREGSGGWTSETIDAVGAIAAYTSLVVDSTGALHASYYDSTLGAVRYATRAAGSASTWQKETVALVGTGSGGYNDIAVDAQNKAHIAYYNATLTRLEIATRK